jgi:hypothetical protein
MFSVVVKVRRVPAELRDFCKAGSRLGGVDALEIGAAGVGGDGTGTVKEIPGAVAVVLDERDGGIIAFTLGNG